MPLIAVLLACAAGCRVKGVETLEWDASAGMKMPQRFSLLCWNVRKGKDAELPERLQTLADELTPDLIFLQEADIRITQLGGYGGVFAPGWSYPWPGGRKIGVAILSRAEPVSVEKLPTKDRELGVTAPKVSLAATWDLPDNETLLVINVHGLVFEGGQKLKGYRRQLAGIKDLADDHDGPILLAGDFNTWSDYRLAFVQEMAAELDLQEVESFEGDVPRTTSDMGSESSNSSFGVNPDLAIDRVFVRGLTVIEAVVLDETASDHVPLFVRFQPTLSSSRSRRPRSDFRRIPAATRAS